MPGELRVGDLDRQHYRYKGLVIDFKRRLEMSDKKREQLGMNPATAASQLRKMILFDFVKRLGLDKCYRCGTKIEKKENLSIEHKKAWLDSENPAGLFFDLNNIAFSHLRCNNMNGRRRATPTVQLECDECDIKFDRPVRRHRKNLKQGRTLKFCTRQCRSKHTVSSRTRANGKFS